MALARGVLLATLAGLAGLGQAQPPAWQEQTLTVPFVGNVTAYVPHLRADAVILFISGDGGWNLGVVDMARRIMPRAIVVGISYPALRKAHPAGGRCWQPAGDLEEIAHAAERQLGLPEYRPPILVGYSSGATLVYGVLASAPASAFAGGLSMGFCPDLPSNVPVCGADGFTATFDAKKGTAWLPKMPSLARDFYVLNGVQDQVCLSRTMHAFLDDMKAAHFIEVPGTGHGFGRPVRWGPPFDEVIVKLLAAAGARGRAPAAPVPASAAVVAARLEALDLPLSYRWATAPHAALLFISGDGGWATLDDRVAAYLADRGVDVVGLSSLRYFWSAKTPAQAGADLRRVIDALASSATPLFVGGYSFGAEVTPFILSAWPDADRRRVNGQVLVAPGETATFEVSPLDWVRRPPETPRRVADAVRALNVPVLCLSGEQEAARDSACDDLAAPAETPKLPGSHHFNGNYDAVGRSILAFIDRHLSRRDAPRFSRHRITMPR
jgi:type IV secretory pathway VirJ component